MRIGFFNYYESLNRNRMFEGGAGPLGDDLLYPTVYLGQQLRQRGHEVGTIDTAPLESFDAIVFMDFPTMKNEYFRRLVESRFDNLYLMLLESPIHRPDNFDPRNHVHFKKIFTWDDSLADGAKFVKMNLAVKIPPPDDSLSARAKLCTAIFSNKSSSHPQELYSERVRAIRWFEARHPEDFDLFGMGWDDRAFRGPRLVRALNRIPGMKRAFGPRFPSYRGPVQSKRETLRKYKFAISFENAKGFRGYITEKIFDCLFASCIPIYLGAPDIAEKVPPECFVDFRDFRGYDELYEFMRSMPDRVYEGYLRSIREFVGGPGIRPFSPEAFAQTLIATVGA